VSVPGFTMQTNYDGSTQAIVGGTVTADIKPIMVS